jgi:hypothetical protein
MSREHHEYSKIFKFLFQQSGLTLVEILMGVAISGGILAATGFSYKQMLFAQHSLYEKLTAEEDVNGAAHILQSYFSMALNLAKLAPPATMNAATFKKNIGLISTYSIKNWVPTMGPGGFDTVAFFVREAMVSGTTAVPVTGIQRFPVTTIFFQKPTVNKYGVIYIGSLTNVGAELAPRDADFKVQRVVDFAITEVFTQVFNTQSIYAVDNDLAGQEMVTSINLQITTRNYFGGAGDGHKMTWCPPPFMPSGATPDPQCTADVPYKDTTRFFAFNIRNNVLGRSYYQRGTADNTLDPTLTPTAQPPAPYHRRTIDGVYFLSPSIPIGTISR